MIDLNLIKNDLVKVTKGILNSVSPDGVWGSQDHTDWGPVITVLTIDYLLSCQMDITEEWIINTESSSFKCSIEKSLHYLNSQIKDTGSFGADFWDVCKLGELIEKHKLYKYFSNYTQLKTYITLFISKNKLAYDETEWSGIGMYMACLDYLILINDSANVQALYDKVLPQMHNEGFFFGKKNKLNSYIIHPIWHTAQFVRFMCRNKDYYNQDVYDKVFNWMCNVQGNNGEFDYFNIFTYYYTCYAIIAFSYYSDKNDTFINKAISYIHKSITSDGIVGDSGGTIMTVIAFSEFVDQDTLKEILQRALYEHQIILTSDLEQYKNEIKELKAELTKYKIMEDNTEFKFSKKDVWKFGILLTIFGIFVSVIPSVIPLILFFLEK